MTDTVTLGFVAATPVVVDKHASNFLVTRKVLLGATAYSRGIGIDWPPGWPTSPAQSPPLPPHVPTLNPPGTPIIQEPIAAGSTILLFDSEAASLVALGAATLA